MPNIVSAESFTDLVKNNPQVRESAYQFFRLRDEFLVTINLKNVEQPKFNPKTETTEVTSYFLPVQNALVKGKFPANKLLVYTDDIGGNVAALRPDGSIEWTYSSVGKPRSIGEYEQHIMFAASDKIIFLDKKSGKATKKSKTPHLGIIQCVSNMVANHVFLCLFKDGESSVVRFDLVTNKSEVLPNLSTAFARGIYADDHEIVVADTFNHEYKIYKLKANKVVETISDYYPNDVTQGNDKKLLFLSEHSNRLMSFDRENKTLTRLFGLTTSWDDKQITKAEFSTYNRDVSTESSVNPSIADKKFSGERTLYSPNGLFFDAETNDLYIADTDNSRIVRINDQLKIVGIMEGILNPVSIVVVDRN